MRVLHVVQPTEAGVPRVLLEYARRQQLAGLDVAVACPPGGDLSRDLADLNIPHLPWAAQRSPLRGVLSESRRLKQIVRRWQPDVVHLHSSKAGLVGRLTLRGGIRTIFQPHAWSFEAVGGLTGVLSLAWERRAQAWTHETVCVSQDELDEGRRRKVLTGGHVFPNSVDPSRWTPIDRLDARRQLGLPATDPTAVCIGRVCRQKGQDILLDIWPLVRSAVPDAILFCAGEGPDRAAWSGQEVEGVRFVGPDHPLPWYSAADVVIAPSRWEGMALVPLEAHSVGRPVIAHDVAGMRQALHGMGTVVDPADRRALTEAVIQLLSDPATADTIGRRARRDSVARWDADEGRTDVAALYRGADRPR